MPFEAMTLYYEHNGWTYTTDFAIDRTPYEERGRD